MRIIKKRVNKSNKTKLLIPIKSFGNSMLPLLHDKDIVYVQPINFNNIKINDIVAFKKKGKILIHRAIFKSGSYIIAKGDNNLESDGRIFTNQVVGIVQYIKRGAQLINPSSLYLIQSTIYFQQLAKISKLFQKNNINFVFLKGLLVHLFYEKTHPHRYYVDCDILVKKNQFFTIKKILLRQGYKIKDTSFPFYKNLFLEDKIEFLFYKKIRGIIVKLDVHLEIGWSLTQLGTLNDLYPKEYIINLTNEMLENVRNIKINNISFPLLNKAYPFVYLALHYFHHNLKGVYRLELLSRIFYHSLNERKNILILIKKFQLQNFVYPVFVILKKYCCPTLPNSLLNSIKPSNVFTRIFISRLIKTKIFNSQPRTQAGVIRFRNMFFLSPRPFLRRFLVFVRPRVLFFIGWVLFYKRFPYPSAYK